MKNFIKIICLLPLFLLFQQCASDSADAAFSESGDTGVGGSYARFIVKGDFLYVVDQTSIKTFSLSDPVMPVQVDFKDVGDEIESLFRLDNRLFIGSGSGLYIYEIDGQGIPQSIGKADYELPFYPCDPVVADEQFAYVTLNTLNAQSSCGRVIIEQVNVLKIFDLTNIAEPRLVREYGMYNPKGVGIDGNTLFVCDDEEGLKIYDVTNREDIQLIKQFDDFTAFDVIPLNGLLLVVATDNIYQFDYTELGNIRLISAIPIQA